MEGGKKKRPSKPGPNATRHDRSPIPPLTPSFSPRDDGSSMFARQYTRQLSASPPPSFTYSQYPASDPPPIHAPYPQHAPFHTLPAPYPDFPSQPLYLPPLPLTRPGYDSAPTKAEGNFNEDEMINHFGMSYPTSMGGIEVPTTQSYAGPNAYVNSPEYIFHLSLPVVSTGTSFSLVPAPRFGFPSFADPFPCRRRHYRSTIPLTSPALHHHPSNR